MIETKFDVPFVADLALREKQIQQNYRPIIAVHKWFARRPGTLFRALLLSEFVEGDLRSAFYRSNDLRGIAVCDPFMGGGTPLLEANRAGCDVVGTDINPMAFWIVREEIQHIDVPSYSEGAARLRNWLTRRVGRFYKTTCAECGARDADVKYFLWVKTTECDGCGSSLDLFPGYLLAENRRHPRNVFICAQCGSLVETDDRKTPGTCPACLFNLARGELARRGVRRCGACGARCTFPKAGRGAPAHRMVAIEYMCPGCRASRAGRFFKTPDADDLARYAEAERVLAATKQVYVPDDSIPLGDETNRLHRWGYRHYREMFNPRQLLGLELSCQGLMKHRDARIRRALATNLSDLLRYQNMLCRYDTMALKSLDVFSVHGFPVGLMQCESNILGVADPRTGAVIGSGGWLNIIGKYARAKAYCDRPFEVAHHGSRKVQVPLTGEFIGEAQNGVGAGRTRRVDLRCGPAAHLEIAPNTLDAVMTDPPYLANVQYAELMDFCYVWLRRLMGETSRELSRSSTRHADELTSNMTQERGFASFAEGLSAAVRKVADGLKPGAPFVFTYHHNRLEAYYPVAVALLDARLVCTATLPCPAEMGASIHINNTRSSIVDSVFVCRRSGSVRRATLPSEGAGLAALVTADTAALRASGMCPTVGDIRCIAFGHFARLAVWRLRGGWDAHQPVKAKLEAIGAELARMGAWSLIEHHLTPATSGAPQIQRWAVAEAAPPYGGADEIVF